MKKMIPKILGSYLNLTAPLFPKLSREHAFKILCYVKRTPLSEAGKQFVETANTQFLEVPDSPVALHSWGHGPKNILFLHGWKSHSKRWQPYLAELDPEEYTLYSIDAPAHGFSPGNQLNLEMYRQAVALALEEIGSIDCLIAHSLGSLVTAYTYLENPEIDVKRYVIMGAPEGMQAIFDYFQELLSLSDRTMTNLHKKIEPILKLPAEEITMKNFFEIVQAPTLVIHEKSDMVTPFAPIQQAVQNQKNIETFFTEGQDHNLTEEETLTKIFDYLKSTKIKESYVSERI